MTKRRKILTGLALAIFGVIILFHYCRFDPRWADGRFGFINPDPAYPGIKDVRMPLFVLAVFYAGLFFILGPDKNKKPSE
jgi:hypothetical protein